jgi:hypothetical protein
VGAERDRAADIVARDGGLLKAPGLYEFGEKPRLGGDGDVEPLPALGLAEAEQVEDT